MRAHYLNHLMEYTVQKYYLLELMMDVIGTVGMMKDSTGFWGTGISTRVSVGKA
jgi:hypothetical protein